MSEQPESEQQHTQPIEPTEEFTLDIVQSVVPEGEEYLLTAALVDQLLAKSHEAVQEGLFVAAVPDSYNLDLLTALRTRDDGKNEKMRDRLRKFSFVATAWHDDKDRVIGLHRQLLNERFIERDRIGYIAAHRSVVEFYQDHPYEDPAVQLQHQLYHTLLADADATNPDNLPSISLMLDAFRAYSNERQRASIERLLKTAADVQPYLEKLQSPWLSAYRDLIIYLHARYAQMQGDWEASLEPLQQLRQKEDLWSSIRPFIGRSYANALANKGEFVDAINEYRTALRELGQLSKEQQGEEQAVKAIEAEKGTTMIALGDAYAGLAISSRGYHENVRDNRALQRFLDWLQTFFGLPIVIYLWVHFGWRVWHPEYWIALRGEDWIIIRLFTQSAKWYRRADPLLEQYGSPNEGVSADERLAYLMLEMQDLREARKIFKYLLDEIEAPLGEYRRASVQVGQAETVLRLKRPGQAFILLQEALPILEKYEDRNLQARARGLLGQALYYMGDLNASITQYQEAQQLYAETENIVAATELIERLQDILVDGRLSRHQKTRVYEQIEKTTTRQYPVRFEHPFLKRFRQGAVIVFLLALFFVPLIVLDFNVTNGISPNINFKPAPLLDIDGPININLREGFNETGSAQANVQTNVTVLAEIAAYSLIAYVTIALVTGLAVIRLTSLRTVQNQSEKGMVYLSAEGIQHGRAGDFITWGEITHFHTANLNRVLSTIPLKRSLFGLETDDGRRLVISGQTSWYNSLLAQVDQYIPVGIDDSDNSTNIIKQPWLWLFLAGLIFIWSLALSDPLSQWFAITGSRLTYRGRDFYPYLYLSMFLPLLWWGFIRPWPTKLRLEPTSLWPWYCLAGGFFLVLLIVITRSRPLITVPDVYTPLLTVTLLSTGGLFIWRREGDLPVDLGFIIRPLVALAALSGIILATGIMARNIVAHHYYAQGNHFNVTGIEGSDREISDIQYNSALNSYNTAVELAQFPPYFSEEDSIHIPFGIPDHDTMTGISAIRARGTMYAQLGQYELAIADYEEILPLTEQPDLVHAWIGIAQQNLGHQQGQNFTEEEENAFYTEALWHYSEAIRLSNSRTAHYFLWRAVTHHALQELTAAHDNYNRALEIDRDPMSKPLNELERSQAYQGLGWVDFTDGNYEEALSHFDEAIDADENSADAYIGLTYAAYELELYQLAQDSAAEAHEIHPDDALPLAALGNIAWRQGTLVLDDDDIGGQRVCDSTVEATDAQRQTAADFWDTSVDYLTEAAARTNQNVLDIAYTYRTRGQVNWLLRNCPGHDKTVQLENAVESYANAVEYDSNNGGYWQMYGRLGYALWLELPPSPESDQLLLDSYDNLWESNLLEPNNSETERWLFDYVNPSVTDIAGVEAVAIYEEARQAGEPVKVSDFVANNSCNYGFRWVSDITIPDDTVFAPDTPFTKIWEIRNTGSCDWEEGTRWIFSSGAEMSAPAYYELPKVQRGKTVEVAVDFITPSEEGSYQSDWSLQSPDGAITTENSTFIRIIVSEEGAESEDEIAAEESCRYQTAFVEDITIPDNTKIKPGEPFEKIWRIRNASTCDWDSAVRWVFKRGDQLGDTVAIPMPATAVGETVDLAVTLVAPTQPGTYRSDWALQVPDGSVLNKTYYVQIVVPEEEIETFASEEELGDTDEVDERLEQEREEKEKEEEEEEEEDEEENRDGTNNSNRPTLSECPTNENGEHESEVRDGDDDDDDENKEERPECIPEPQREGSSLEDE